MEEVTSKHIDGISDLVVLAPIKPGFIQAYENVSHATRLKLVAEALNRIRIAAREHERALPYADVTERILNLLDFRIGVLDRDLFGLSDADSGHAPGPRRYLYLAATFEGGFEPYMRLIWHPLGAFLDLLFCNCEGYVTAVDHPCEEYLQWVRDHQVDSAIFYNTTGLSTRDQRYLGRLERLQRAGADGLALAGLTMPYPDDEARAERGAQLAKALELGLEALTVLYKLADYYPPEWMMGPMPTGAAPAEEGHRLIRAAQEVLRGWREVQQAFEQAAAADPVQAERLRVLRAVYQEPLTWFETGAAAVAARDAALASARPVDPAFDPAEVQAGILHAQLGPGQSPRHGALLLFTVREAAGARRFIGQLLDGGWLRFDTDGARPEGDARPACSIGFTPQGLLELGLAREVQECFPKEFREGPAPRSGLMGDQRENHPRNWMLPVRNGPAFTGAVRAGTALPPVELDEVDFVLHLRSSAATADAVLQAVRDLGALAAPAATLEAIDWLHLRYAAPADPQHPGGDKPVFIDHFGYRDGISQPRPTVPGDGATPGLARDQVRLGEVLLGYANDRGDPAPGNFDTLDGPWPDAGSGGTLGTDNGLDQPTAWRRAPRRRALDLQRNGSFLVLRKIGQDVVGFEAWLGREAWSLARQLGCDEARARGLLMDALMGRDAQGRPLAQPGAAQGNDFDYAGDEAGLACPHAAHIRRANPRRTGPDVPTTPRAARAEFGRPTPRLLRRGMLFGGRADDGSEAPDAPRGLMFMAYNASIAEQYEVVQRWLNGGNSTDVVAAQADPLSGVLPRQGQGGFRFVAPHAQTGQPVVLNVPLPRPVLPDAQGGRADALAVPGRHPFTPLYWMLYLFTPSRGALRQVTAWTGGRQPLRTPQAQAVGQAWLARQAALPPAQAGLEWKRLLEDFDTKDPTEADLSPPVWAAIQALHGGALDLRRPGARPGAPAVVLPIPGGTPSAGPPPAGGHDWNQPDWRTQHSIVCAGKPQLMQVLAQWQHFTVEEQQRRIIGNSGPIYVTQQPDGQYLGHGQPHRALRDRLNYHQEAQATNAALMAYGEADAFKVGYAAGSAVLAEAKRVALLLPRAYFKLELRRQYILPAIAGVWNAWYGLPDGRHMHLGGWSWKRIVAQIADQAEAAVSRTQALCPGDFLSPSRHSFYPRPGDELKHFAQTQGEAILKAGLAFVRAKRQSNGPFTALAQTLFDQVSDDEVLARNLIGTMIGAIPPMDANLRNILFDWLSEKTLWRHQAALRRALAGQAAHDQHAAADAVLRGPLSRAMCKRPAPDLLYRTAKHAATIARGAAADGSALAPVKVQAGDMVVLSLVAATQQSLHDPATPDGDLDIVFGGRRLAATQGYRLRQGQVRPDPRAPHDAPVHACPAQRMAMGAMTGILAALLQAGSIQAQPASLIVRISDW